MKNNLYKYFCHSRGGGNPVPPNSQKGGAGIAVVIVLLLLIAGGGYFFTRSSSTGQSEETPSAIADLGVSVPDMDFSSSPLPDLNVTSLNVAMPEFGGAAAFSVPDISSNFSFDAKNIDVAMPSIPTGFDMPSFPSGIPAGIPANIPNIPKGVDIPSGIPAGIPSGAGAVAPTGDTAIPAGAGVPKIDCSLFASVPSCSFVPENVREMCQKCK